MLLRAKDFYDEGITQGAIQGNVYQRGGIFLINKVGDCLYAFNEKEIGHEPDWKEFLKLLNNCKKTNLEIHYFERILDTKIHAT